MKRQMFCPLKLKGVDEDKGIVSGYASIFGNVDLGGDIITKDEPFKEFVKTDDGKVLTLFQHDSQGFTESAGLPVGLAEVEQNTRGLKFESQLILDDPFVQRLKTHLKAKSLSGVSIGYDILPGGAQMMENGVRELKALRLWEISFVTFPMNPKARVSGVKGAGITTLREFEDYLGEALWDAMLHGKRPSRDDIKLLASGGWKHFASTRDASGSEDEAAETVKRMLDIFKAPSAA